MFTMDNTDGFTQAELNILNRVADALVAEKSYERSNAADAVNNAWCAGMTEAELRAAVGL